MRKLIAGFMTALIALLTATSPVLAATQLGSYPTFLAGTDGTLGAYVVVGSTANPADVVGAIDLATRLAEVGKTTTTTSCSGSSAAVDGVSKDTVTIQRGYLDDFFPGAIRSFHTSKLTTGTYSWASNNYDYYEDIQLGSDQIYTSHDFSTTGINGTQSLVIPTNVLKYRYVFKKALNLGSKNDAKGTATAPEYTYPININLLGKPFQIVGLGTAQVVMLSGSIGTATATTPVVSGDYSAYSDLGSDAAWARVIIKDKAGNTVDTLVITSGSDKTSSAAGLTVKVTAVRALQDGTIVGSDLVIGPTNNIEKTYPATCDISGTGTSDFKFPGETEWCIQATGITTGNITVDDAVEVVYKPATTKYIKSTDATPALALPNSYGYLGFVGTGFNYDSWMTLTFSPKTGLSAYWDDGMTGASNSTLAATNLNGIEISSDVAGSIVNGTNGYNKAYILFNYTLTNTSMIPVMVGFWDSVNNRIAVDPSADAYYKILARNTTDSSYEFNLTISYSNGAATADRQYLWINVTHPLASALTVNSVGAGGASVFTNMVLGKTGAGQYNNSVLINYVNKTSTWSATAMPEYRLFSTSTAEAKDVQAYSTDVSGVEQKADVGTTAQDVVTDAGSIIVSPSAYSGSDIVKVKVPAQVLFAKLYVGKLSSGTSGSSVSYASYPSIPITSAVAKLDTEITAVEKAKNLITVGGPCVNSVTAAALGLTYPACGASSTIPESKGLIKVVASPYTEGTGKVVIVVAGWEFDNTRTATSVLQQYDTKLTGVTASSVEVTGTVGAPTVTAV
jgi:hypothetical protein